MLFKVKLTIFHETVHIFQENFIDFTSNCFIFFVRDVKEKQTTFKKFIAMVLLKNRFVAKINIHRASIYFIFVMIRIL